MISKVSFKIYMIMFLRSVLVVSETAISAEDQNKKLGKQGRDSRALTS